MASDVGSDYKRNHTYLWSPAGPCTSITLSYLRQSGKEIDLHIKGSQLPVLSIERVFVYLYIGLFPIICGYVHAGSLCACLNVCLCGSRCSWTVVFGS